MSKKLFDLIHSMSRSEKRHFSISAAAFKKDGKQAKMYKLLDGWKKYDGTKLKEWASHQNGFENLAVTANDLMSVILRTLRTYHSGRSVESEIRVLLSNIELFIDRGFFEAARKEIQKGFDLCEYHDKPDYALIFLRWNKVVYQVWESSVIEPELIQYHDGYSKQMISQLETNSDYWSSSNLAYHYYRQAINNNDEEAYSKLKEIINSDAYADQSMATTLSAKTMYYAIKILYAQITGSKEEMNGYCRMNIELIKGNREYIRDNPITFLKAQYNLVVSYLDLLQFKEAEAELDSMRQFLVEYDLSSNMQVDMMVFQYTTYLQVRLSNLKGDFTKAVELESVVLLGLEKYSSGLSELFLFKLYYDMSYAFFGNGDYKRALFWINKILQGNVPDWQRGVYHIAILNYMIHYEIGNLDVLISLARSLRRNLLRTESKELDAILKRIVTGMAGIRNVAENKEELHTIILDLQALKTDQLIAGILENLNLVAWLTSKATGKRFAACCLKEAL